MVYEVNFMFELFLNPQICPGLIRPEGHQRVPKVKTMQELITTYNSPSNVLCFRKYKKEGS